MIKVSEKNRHLASYLIQNKEEFMIFIRSDRYEDGGYEEMNLDKLAEIIQEFYDELC